MSLLGLFNFLIVQWFGVRLGRRIYPYYLGDGVVRWRTMDWHLLRWVWPLTGWWSPYRWIARVSP